MYSKMKEKLVSIGIIGLLLIASVAAMTLFSTKTMALNTSEISHITTTNTYGTGFFQVEQRDGKWRFVDPEGKTFFSTGMCALHATGYYAPDLGYSPYYRNILELYGDEETWANVTRDRMDAWGFNTIASGDQYIKATGLAYTLHLGMAGANWTTGDIPDYFSEEWIERTDRIGREVVAPLSNETNLIGYFLDNELHWGPDWRKLTDVFADYCAMPSNSPGKNVLVQFLHNRYKGDINSFNRAWRTRFKNFDKILDVPSLGLCPRTVRALTDRQAFIYIVAEQYFRVCYEAIKRYDENHLILGARFQSYLTPVEVTEACAPYVDVISVNHYFARPLLVPISILADRIISFVRPINLLQEFYDIADRPILISEFNFRARDSKLPNTQPSRLLFPVLPSQNHRANWFERVTRRFIEKPYAVGYHWFCYMDEPQTGRFDGENSNVGVVNEMDEPYEPLVRRMTEINHLAHESVKG